MHETPFWCVKSKRKIQPMSDQYQQLSHLDDMLIIYYLMSKTQSIVCK